MGIFISQDKFVAENPEEFDFANVKTASTPIEIRTFSQEISMPLRFAVCACSSDYAGEIRQSSTTGGCQFLGRRLISWQCKKQTIVATSTTEAEYVAAASCCGQVLWIQNQMLDYGFNFMNIKIYIDNESTICIVKNPVYHSKTKHIAIRHHFIRDAYEKKLIQVLKIHTDDNVADLLTKAFDVSSVKYEETNYPSPRPSPSTTIPDSILKSSGGNLGGHSSSDKSLSGHKGEMTPKVSMIFVSLYVHSQTPQSMDEECLLEAKISKKEILKETIVHRESETKDAMMWEDKKVVEEKVNDEDVLELKQKYSTDDQIEGTEEQSKDENATPTATPTVFGDDETIAEFLVSMSQNKAKQKGVEIKDAEDSNRPRPTSTRSLLTLKPLPKIDPKDKGKKVLEEEAESDAESEGVNEAERKFAQLANDEEIARKVQEEWETEEKNKKLAEEEATKVALIRDYDDIQARIEADSILAARLQEEEREKFTIEERAKLLHDTIAAQRRFLAQQRAAKIRSRPPTRTQLRNQMMTYLKHVGGKKHSDLKTKNFEEIQVLYEKVKRSDENFIAIGSAEDERRIKDVNKKATGIKKDDSIKEESKEEESTRKRKLGTRKKMKSRKRRFRQDTSQDDQTDSEKENDELRLCLTIATDEDKEVDYEILDKKYPIIEWKTEYLGTKPQFGETKRLEEINLNVVIRGNGQRRYFSTLIRVLLIFDREDINVVYQLVMDRYQDEIPEGFDRDWNVVSWKLHGSSGVHTLMTEAGLVIHMLVEKKYPLRRKVLLQMLELKLESEEDSTMALELIRFVKKLIAELEPEDSDGNEEDL
ncbi:hypothetical protein Tco_0413111 [Tanacetum coccineum]